MTTLHDFGGVLGRRSETFLLGSHNFTVTCSWLVCVCVVALGKQLSRALSLIVKWQLKLLCVFRPQVVWFWRCVGTAFGHFSFGSHNFTVTAPRSCVCVVALGKPIVTGLQSPVWSGRSRCCVFSTGGFKWWVTREVALESRSNNPWFCKGTNACREQCDHAPTFIRPTSIG